MNMLTEQEVQWQEFLCSKTEEEKYLLQERAGIHETHGGMTRVEACERVMEDYRKGA